MEKEFGKEHTHVWRLPWRLSGKESSCKAGDAGDMGSIPGSGRSPGVGNGHPLQYSGLENSMDWVVQEVTKNWITTEQLLSLSL